MPQQPQLIEAVSNGLAQKRDTLSQTTEGVPSEVVYVPREYLARQAANKNSSHLLEDQRLKSALEAIDFTQRNIVYLSEGEAFDLTKNRGIKVTSLV